MNPHSSFAATLSVAEAPAVIGASVPGAALKSAAGVLSSAAATASKPIAAGAVRCIRKYKTTFLAAAASLIQSSVKIIVAFNEGVSMRSVYEERLARASKNARTLVQADARTCSALLFGKVCKTIWPFKTAEELAALVGCSVRAAAYEISGEREPSAQSVLAVMTAIIPKRERA